MIVIQTRYLPATDYRPSRIKAFADGVKPLTINYDYEFGHKSDRHAAELLANRENWLRADKELIGGTLPNHDTVWLMIDKQERKI